MSASTTDLNVCRAIPIRDPKTLAAVRAHRKRAEFSFVARTPRETTELPPIDAYAVAFGLEPDARVNQRVQTMFAQEAALIMKSVPYDRNNGPDDVVYTDAPGFIYIFHDLADPPTVLKIGRTTQTPWQRLAQWEHELAPQEGKSLRLLAAYRTSANKFAERIIHEILRCHHIANRINPITNDELDEFFTIDNLMALKLFVRSTLRFIDRYCSYWFQRRKAVVG